MIAAYREPDRTRGRELMRHLIDSISHGVPAALTEVITLGRTLKKRAADVLAYFDRPGTSNGPTEAICDTSNTPAAPPSGSATSPTTSPDHYSRPADSDPNYTLDCEEPVTGSDRRRWSHRRFGEVEIAVPRAPEGSLEPQIVRKRQRRLTDYLPWPPHHGR